MAKKKLRKRKKDSRVLLYIAWILAMIASILSFLVAGYYFGFITTQKETTKIAKVDRKCLPKKRKNCKQPLKRST